jgi:serine/threonine protein kinase
MNVLVDEKFEARLADFGLTLVGDSSVAGMTTTNTGAGSLRWKSPERLEEDARRSMSGDVWAFACLCIVVGVLIYY